MGFFYSGTTLQRFETDLSVSKFYSSFAGFGGVSAAVWKFKWETRKFGIDAQFKL
jgi:hypothetical protein